MWVISKGYNLWPDLQGAMFDFESYLQNQVEDRWLTITGILVISSAQTGVPNLIDDCLMYLVEASWQSFRFCLLLNLFKIGSTSTWQVLNSVYQEYLDSSAQTPDFIGSHSYLEQVTYPRQFSSPFRER